MITAVDSNILLDVMAADPNFGESSSEALRRCRRDGALIVSEIVFAEIATALGDVQGFLFAIEKLSISFVPMTEVAALKAAEIWRQYRKGGGSRVRIAADFLIGAHALVLADRLLTRDRGFYRQYFRGLRILDPSLPH